MHLLKAVGIQLGLLPTPLRVHGSLLCLYDRQRITVIIPKHIVGITKTRRCGLMFDLNFLTNLGRTDVPKTNVPFFGSKKAVNDTSPGRSLIERQQIGSCRAR